MISWIALLSTIWVFIALRSWFAVGAVPSLDDVMPSTQTAVTESTADSRALPSVAVVIASRDEGPRVETTVRRLCAQLGVSLQIILVDDRSAPEEADRLSKLAAEDPRIRLIRINSLPEGWLGKCHALERGAVESNSEWILFSDADTWMIPDLIARSIAEAERTGAQHLCLIPSDKRLSFFGQATTLGMISGFLLSAAEVNRDRRFGFVGVGAFNLVKRCAYREIGGHEPLRLEIVDDAMLGARLRQAGFRSRCRIGYPHLDITWAACVTDLPRVLEKNAFAMTGYRTWLVAALIPFFLLFWGGALLAPLYAGAPGSIPLLALLSTALPAARTAKQYRQPILPALFSPFLLFVAPWAIVRSTWTTIRNDGVTWRETFYPLADLRRGSLPMFPGKRPQK